MIVVCIKGGTQYYTRAGAMGVAALGRQTAYGARPSESRKLRAAAAAMTEVASAKYVYRGMEYRTVNCQVLYSVRLVLYHI